MIELGLVCLLTALIVGFSKLSQSNKISYMLLFMLIGFGMIIGNYFIPTIETTEYYVSDHMIEKPNIKFKSPMVVLKFIYDRPFTFIGDYEEYMIGSFNKKSTPKEKRKHPTSKKKWEHPAKMPNIYI